MNLIKMIKLWHTYITLLSINSIVTLAFLITYSKKEYDNNSTYAGPVIAYNISILMASIMGIKYIYDVGSGLYKRSDLRQSILLIFVFLGCVVSLPFFIISLISHCVDGVCFQIKTPLYAMVLIGFFLISSIIAIIVTTIIISCLKCFICGNSENILDKQINKIYNYLINYEPKSQITTDEHKTEINNKNITLPYTQITQIKKYTHETSCAICVQNFIQDDNLKVLNCSHYYHLACIDKWRETKQSCPKCQSVAIAIKN
ncbi:MAG: hypothetical protein Edafosvirus9_28 [Edafosvirus sp.]|uniref:RING-type domain-containing protein n=1 Tax=Edafosvirus sp. TaxID=2487765 RepID=A0A3G4ZVG1_9VIRU|nr:MAG: hypothetical protein Edafosvirus9_28 [Edafosvirus sp.]